MFIVLNEKFEKPVLQKNKFKIDWSGHKKWKFLNLFTNFTNAVIIKLKIHKSGPLFS